MSAAVPSSAEVQLAHHGEAPRSKKLRSKTTVASPRQTVAAEAPVDAGMESSVADEESDVSQYLTKAGKKKLKKS